MLNYVVVMIGGALGALCRYGVAQAVLGVRVLSMPIGTLIVNLLGCFLLGVLSALGMKHIALPCLSESQSQTLILMMTVGFCGAFTTFSTFSSETIKAMQSGLIWESLVYVLVSVGVGFLLFWWGSGIVNN